MTGPLTTKPSGWQPIETAPKDGTCIILGYFPAPPWDGASVSEFQEIAFWHSHHQKWCGRILLNAEGFYSPTHWHPMLEGPSTKEESYGKG